MNGPNSHAFRGARRCMINRPTFRRIESGCVDCGLSDVACAAIRDTERRKCCDVCQHDA